MLKTRVVLLNLIHDENTLEYNIVKDLFSVCVLRYHVVYVGL